VKRSNRLLILFGLIFALVGGGLAFAVASGGGSTGVARASATPTAEPITTVVTAKQDINLGDQITADMVDETKMTVSAAAKLGPGTFTTKDQVVGKIAGGKISAGQPLVGSRDFLNPGSMTEGKDIAGAIASGYVGVAMELDQVNGVGTLIVPGDRVNIILSVYVPGLDLTANRPGFPTGEAIKGVSDVTTKMVIQNRKVILTLLPPPVDATTGASVAKASPEPVAAPTTPTVHNDTRHMIAIVEVKPDEAEIIRWAQRAEKVDPQNYIDLSMALRSDKDNSLPNAVTPGITFKMLVDKYGVLPPDPRAIIPPDIAKNLQW
jgi:Flp pilus assembly protein CpaB